MPELLLDYRVGINTGIPNASTTHFNTIQFDRKMALTHWLHYDNTILFFLTVQLEQNLIFLQYLVWVSEELDLQTIVLLKAYLSTALFTHSYYITCNRGWSIKLVHNIIKMLLASILDKCYSHRGTRLMMPQA